MTTCIVQCSTGSLAPLGGGRYWNVAAMLQGIRKLAWPAIELRLWQEWDDGDLVAVARKVRDLGVTVNSVHLPPESEGLLSTPGSAEAAAGLMDRCKQAALAAGARVAVVHAWDLRLARFSREALVANLTRFAQDYAAAGLSLSVEAIPGHSDLLPAVADSCPNVSFTLDTQWASLEDSWRYLRSLTPRVTDIHVQTFVDQAEDGIALGRTSAGPGFDAEGFVRGLAAQGYSGLITLEPIGVPAVGEVHLRQALRKLEDWLQEIRHPQQICKELPDASGEGFR